MTMLARIALAATFLLATAAQAQFQPPPLLPPVASGEPEEVPLLQNDLAVKAGSDRVFFGVNSYSLSAPARATLAAHARWLIMNPSVRALIEGHGDDRDTREHALALGERRAAAVRDYLVSQGVPRSRLMVTSWGKERPNAPVPGSPAVGVSARVVTLIVR
jgi:peptidoglycan-associated lipoprotein